jgi:hypothetical protein
VRVLAVVKGDRRGFSLYLCVIVMFICESSVRREDRVQGMQTMFVCERDIY